MPMWRGTPTYLPDDTLAQLEAIGRLCEDAIGECLLGLILHGSAATTGFEPGRSDLDLLVVVSRRLVPGECRSLGRALLGVSGQPHPVELSVVLEDDLRNWQHPCRHEFHFGEDHRGALARGRFVPARPRDEDLAAHITMARARGISLRTGYPAERLPAIPTEDYLRAVLADLCWARERGLQHYLEANACRTAAFLRSGQILSKHEGVAWCRGRGLDVSRVVDEVVDELRRLTATQD